MDCWKDVGTLCPTFPTHSWSRWMLRSQSEPHWFQMQPVSRSPESSYHDDLQGNGDAELFLSIGFSASHCGSSEYLRELRVAGLESLGRQMAALRSGNTTGAMESHRGTSWRHGVGCRDNSDLAVALQKPWSTLNPHCVE